MNASLRKLKYVPIGVLLGVIIVLAVPVIRLGLGFEGKLVPPEKAPLLQETAKVASRTEKPYFSISTSGVKIHDLALTLLIPLILGSTLFLVSSRLIH